MKLNKMIFALALVVAGALASTGCKHEPVDVTNIPETKPAFTDIGSGTLNGGESGGPIAQAPLSDFDNMVPDPQALAQYSIHFAYDSAAIRNSEQAKLQAVASALSADPSTKLTIEGNCDERGTEEYNRSLGERRALAAREELIRLGLPPVRVDTKSWGEDNPANNQGHDESAWRENRRGDFILLTPP